MWIGHVLRMTTKSVPMVALRTTPDGLRKIWRQTRGDIEEQGKER